MEGVSAFVCVRACVRACVREGETEGGKGRGGAVSGYRRTRCRLNDGETQHMATSHGHSTSQPQHNHSAVIAQPQHSHSTTTALA